MIARIVLWFSRLWRRASERAAPRYNVLMLPLSAEQLAFFTLLAKQQQTEPAALIVDLALQSVPMQVRERFSHGYRLGRALDCLASEVIDDSVEQHSVPPELPPHDEPDQRVTNVIRLPITPVPAHPCIYLEETFSTDFGPNACYGTCRAPRNGNRPCFRPAATASACSYYRARRVPNSLLRGA